MTTLNLPVPTVAQSVLNALSEAGVRPPTSTVGTPVRSVTWAPDLTAQEQATVDLLVQLAIGSSLLTPADYAAITPRLDALRVFRQQSQSEFMAKTANVRDRELFDAMNDVSAILLRVLRTT